MKLVQWGTFTKEKRDSNERERIARNEEFVKQQIKLPSGAKLTICKPPPEKESEL
jgi:hypothetical protein